MGELTLGKPFDSIVLWDKPGRRLSRHARSQRTPLGEFLNRELYRLVQHAIQEQLLRSNEKPFRGGLVFKARRLVVSLNSRPRVIKKK